MTLLILGLLLFFFPHFWRELGLRRYLIDLVASESTYKAIFSLMSVAGFIMLIMGKADAPFTMLYQPAFELRWISHLVMLPALYLVLLGNLPMSHIRYHLRHPMLLGVLLWGLAHLWANGDLASTLLFGSFSLWAAIKFVTLHKQPRPPKMPRIGWDLLGLVIALVAYGLIFVYHGELFGVGLAIA